MEIYFIIQVEKGASLCWKVAATWQPHSKGMSKVAKELFFNFSKFLKFLFF
jgi:hypothetical protein